MVWPEISFQARNRSASGRIGVSVCTPISKSHFRRIEIIDGRDRMPLR